MSQYLVLKRIPLAIAVQIAMLNAPATAQETSAPADGIERIEVLGKYTVNETIDTATGLGLSLPETPQSVSVVTVQRIKDKGFSSIIELISQSIGLWAKQVDTTRNTFSVPGFDIDKYQIDGVSSIL